MCARGFEEGLVVVELSTIKVGGVATIQPNDRPQRRVVNKGAMGSPEVTYSAAGDSCAK